MYGRPHRRFLVQTLVWKELFYGKMSDKEKQLLVGEVNILRELRHPHIVRYYDRIIDRARTKLYIVMEHCEGGDMRKLIKRQRSSGKHLDEATVWRLLAQILIALECCHQHKENGQPKPILHHDRKVANLLVLGVGSNTNLSLRLTLTLTLILTLTLTLTTPTLTLSRLTLTTSRRPTCSCGPTRVRALSPRSGYG